MNDSLLNALSAAISDNPAHVLQLRKIVVALAISGRLNEADASIDREEILALLDDVKRRLIYQRVLAKHKPIAAITRDQLPDDFSDPSKFISLGQIARVEKGKTGIQQAKPGPYPLVVTAAERITADHYDFDGAAAIIPLVSSTGHGNASINRLHYQEGQFALGTILAAVLPHDQALFSARFLFEYLSAFKEELLVSRMSGTANVTLTLGRIEDIPIPLVPPAIQRQLDELMALCDEMEEARTERETKRDRLAAASLARLNTPDPETFHDDVRFALDALPALTARPDQIKQLRQTILNLAVRGKLVPQDPADEPTEELLKRISAEKVQLVAQKKLRRQKELQPIDDDAIPFDLGEGWKWAKADDVFLNITDGFHNTPSPVTDGYPYVTAKHIRPNKIDFENCLYVDEKNHRDLYAKTRVKGGDILIVNIGAGCGTSAMVDVDYQFSFKNVAVVNMPSVMNGKFILIFLSYYRHLIFDDLIKGGAQPFLGLGMLKEMLVPLPPLAEQNRIVAKVDELMALCDQLETTQTSADETRTKLLDALLAEALAPDAEALQEAAE